MLNQKKKQSFTENFKVLKMKSSFLLHFGLTHVFPVFCSDLDGDKCGGTHKLLPSRLFAVQGNSEGETL